MRRLHSAARRRSGLAVEYDAGVNVIHRHPLQNRAVSPKMRVIIRHSKLLYFRKHLPGWQFLGLPCDRHQRSGGSWVHGMGPGSCGGGPGMEDHSRHDPPAERGRFVDGSAQRAEAIDRQT